MPIIVKDFTWIQNENAILIKIPIRSMAHEDVDVFTTDSYIKVHFSPFLFEVFLLHDVCNDKSTCTVKDDLITIDLVKKEHQEWESLEKDLPKAEKMKLRQEILDKCVEKAQQDAEDKRIKKSQLDRFTVQQAMDIDSTQHNLMDSRRDAERKNAMDALEEWRVNISGENTKAIKNIIEIEQQNINTDVSTEIKDDDNQKNNNSGVKIVELITDENDKKQSSATVTEVSSGEVFDIKGAGDNKPPRNTKKHVKKPVKIPVKSEFVEKKKEEASKRVLPRLRETVQLEITHTPRTFPTPSRESKADEEQAWLKNITLARRATGFVSEDLRPEEQDPQWCKEKGDEFFRNGNFLGAVSAYSHGITLSDKLPSLYANRSVTHFALGNFNKCMQDCSTALDLMKPPCEGNRKSRAKCIARRAAALARLGYLSKAINEMKAASKLLPEDETIKKDIYDMEKAWEQNPDSD